MLVSCTRGHLVPLCQLTLTGFGAYCPACLGWVQYLAQRCHALRECREIAGPGYEP